MTSDGDKAPISRELSSRADIKDILVQVLENMTDTEVQQLVRRSRPGAEVHIVRDEETQGVWDYQADSDSNRRLIERGIRGGWNIKDKMRDKAITRVDEALDHENPKFYQKAVDQVIQMEASDQRKMDMYLRHKRLEEGKPTEIRKTIGTERPPSLTQINIGTDSTPAQKKKRVKNEDTLET
jgi:hypothetical protein